MKRVIKITESELRSIIKESVNEALVNEGWGKNALGALAFGATAMFGNNANAQNNNVQQSDSIQQQTVQQQNVQQQLTFTMEELINLFPQAYKDRDKSPKVWGNKPVKYAAKLPNGKFSLVGQIAASHGENPWDAIVKRYCPQENTFSLWDDGAIIQ